MISDHRARLLDAFFFYDFLIIGTKVITVIKVNLVLICPKPTGEHQKFALVVVDEVQEPRSAAVPPLPTLSVITY